MHDFVQDIGLYAAIMVTKREAIYNFKCDHGLPHSVNVELEQSDTENFATVKINDGKALRYEGTAEHFEKNPILTVMDVREKAYPLEIGVIDDIYLKVDGIDFNKMMDRPTLSE